MVGSSLPYELQFLLLLPILKQIKTELTDGSNASGTELLII